MAIVLALAGVGGLAVAVWRLPPTLYPADAPEARAALQGGLLTAAAALLAVAGGLVALTETRQANENTHVRELYVEAVKLLSDSDSSIRLGGIYALERIAVDAPKYQRTIVEVLSALVRERSTDPALRPTPPADGDGVFLRRPVADIRAAVRVLARLPPLPFVTRCDLNGADLTGPARLADLDLTYADLGGAWLGRADLTGAYLHHADLTEALLIGADLTGAHLVRTTLTGARLHGVILTDADLAGARLYGADLSRVEGLEQAQLDAARGDGKTELPEGLTRPASWPNRYISLLDHLP